MARILVLDDEKTIQDLFFDILTFYGHEVVAMSDGQEVVNLLKNDASFNMAFFDINNKEGKGATDIIGEIRKDLPDLKIFVMSSDIFHEAMLKPTKFGFNMSMEKPFKVAELKKIVEEG